MSRLSYKILGWCIRKARMLEGVTQQEYADARDVEWELIIRLEAGKPRPKNYMLMLYNSHIELRFR